VIRIQCRGAVTGFGPGPSFANDDFGASGSAILSSTRFLLNHAQTRTEIIVDRNKPARKYQVSIFSLQLRQPWEITRRWGFGSMRIAAPG
jgi:hypothetical protein